MKGNNPGTQNKKNAATAQVWKINAILLILVFVLIAVTVVIKILPLPVVMLAALLLYVVGQYVLMKRFVFKPHDNLVQELKHKDEIMSAGNRCAALLLRAIIDGEMPESAVLQSMEIMGRCMDADRVHIWRNEKIDDAICFVHQHEWLNDNGYKKAPIPIGVKFPYSDIQEWADAFSRNEYIAGPLSAQTENARKFLNAYEIKSIVIIPLFVQDQFWGFFSLDDCRRERGFSDDEINILRSVGLMMANSVLRNKMTHDNYDTAAKLEALISNYSGIIWSVDKNNIITLLNGLYIKTLGVTPERYEGWKLDEAQEKNRRLEIISNVQKTFDEGPQDWITEVDGKTFHAHNTLIFDNNDRVTGVVGTIDDITEMARLQNKLEALLFKIEGLDIKKGIERFGNDKESYFEILRSYAANTPVLLEKAKRVSGNINDYTVVVHEIKGASRGINADTVGNQAEALEKAGKAGDLDFVIANNPAFLETAARLVNDIKDMLEKI